MQLKAMMTEVDNDSHTLLAMAASSGDKDTFNAVLAAVTEELGQAKVRVSIYTTYFPLLNEVYAVEITKENNSIDRT